jgi:hypothetical protein
MNKSHHQKATYDKHGKAKTSAFVEAAISTWAMLAQILIEECGRGQIRIIFVTCWI